MTANKNAAFGTAVFGVYSTPQGVERAGDTLVASGFCDADISVLLPDNLDACTQRDAFVLSVNCGTPDQVERAKEIIERTMADDISVSPEASSTIPSILGRALHRTAC